MVFVGVTVCMCGDVGDRVGVGGWMKNEEA